MIGIAHTSHFLRPGAAVYFPHLVQIPILTKNQYSSLRVSLFRSAHSAHLHLFSTASSPQSTHSPFDLLKIYLSRFARLSALSVCSVCFFGKTHLTFSLSGDYRVLLTLGTDMIVNAIPILFPIPFISPRIALRASDYFSDQRFLAINAYPFFLTLSISVHGSLNAYGA